MQPVFTTYRGGFGDCWGAANYFLRRSERTGQPTLVWNLDPRIRAIAQALRTTGSIQQVNHPPDTMIVCYWRQTNVDRFIAQFGRLPETVLSWRMLFGEPYLEACQTWNASDSRTVTYQLVPRNARGPSACPSEHVQLFVNRMRRLGYQPVRLGSHLSIEECVSLAAKSRYFVGVDSGMSHLCHSVRVPVHLVRNGLPGDYIGKVTHRGNPCEEYADIPAFLESHLAS